MRVKGFTELANLDPEEFVRHGSQAIGSLADAVNGSLSFDVNMNTKTVTAVFTAANTDLAITHNLGRIPTGYLQSKASANMVIFDGSRVADKNTSYLRSSAPGTITLIFH
jgi:hypothetical protein